MEEGEYEEAARLRDQGMSGLLGWWRGKSSNDDPYGHIMQVTQGFGRYTAIAFSPRDLDKVTFLVPSYSPAHSSSII